MKILDQGVINALKNNDFKDQSELVEYFLSQGMEITQAALSRRLKRLGVKKVEGVYKPSFGLGEDLFSKCVLDVVIVPPNLIIVRTIPGFANTFAYFLDESIEAKRSESSKGVFEAIAGTLAGDDTVFIAVGDLNQLEKLHKAIEELASKGVDVL
ncbi:hypothetical protein KAU11_00700 [Candidatus Babeliales bacterium]|nr:hypothetical protein [Candidatus Babeliales bacterium]